MLSQNGKYLLVIYLVLFISLLVFVLLETAFLILPLTLIGLFSIGLISTSPVKYPMAFFTGIFFDFLSGTVFPLTTILFLGTLFIANYYRSHLPVYSYTTFIIFLILEYLFFRITGVYPGIIPMVFGLFGFLIISRIVYLILIPSENKGLQFDIIKR